MGDTLEERLTRMDESVLRRLEAIDDLPTIPLVIRKVEKAIDDPKSTAKEVAAVIEDDPSIMARILKVVNSAFYRPLDGREVSSLPLAVARLGFKTIKNIALTTSVFSMLGQGKVRVFDLNKFWQHCITTGIICNIVYEVCGGNLKSIYTKDDLHLMGLLHDMGKIILGRYFSESFAEAIELSEEKHQHILISEEELLHANHAQIGAWLAHKWSLPPAIVHGILYHHAPEEAPEQYLDLVAITHISDFVCLKGQFGFSGSSVLPKFEGGVWKYLGLNMEGLNEILDRTRQEEKESLVLLGIMSSE